MEKKLFVFESAPDFADNSRGFWEYLKNNENVDTFWCVRDENMCRRMQEKGIRCALFGTDEANEMIEQADCFITSSFEFAYAKRKNQIHVSAWHGFPLKLIGYFDSASPNTDFMNLKVITAQSDIITATSRTCQLNMSGMLSVDPNKVKVTGFPRNDLLYTENGKENLKKLLNVDLNSKFIFYLPTMRKGLKDEGKQFEDNIFNYDDYDVQALDAFLAENNAYIVTKFHFADQEYYKKNNFEIPKRMILLDTSTMNEQLLTIYHIMNAFDVLITDYSSVYVDYLLLDRPIVFSCPDLEKYKKDRGFVVEDPSLLMPGTLVRNQKELINALRACDFEKDKRKNMMSYFHKNCDSYSSKRLYDEIVKKFLNNDYDFDKKLGKAHLYLDQSAYMLHPLNQKSHKQFHPHYSVHSYLYTAFHVFNGVQVENKIFLLEFDPQIHIDLNKKNIDSLNISFTIYESYQNMHLITEVLCEVNEKNCIYKNELNSIKNSRSYKATEKIKKVIKR